MTGTRISPTFTEEEVLYIKTASNRLGYNPSQFLRHAALSIAHKHCRGICINNLPKQTRKELLTDRIRVRLRPKEIKILRKKAKEYGYSLSGIFREAAFAFFKNEKIYPKEVLSQASILSSLLRNIGTNINQIARYTNRKRKITIFNLIKVRELIKNLEKEVLYFLNYPSGNGDKVDESKDKKF